MYRHYSFFFCICLLWVIPAHADDGLEVSAAYLQATLAQLENRVNRLQTDLNLLTVGLIDIDHLLEEAEEVKSQGMEQGYPQQYAGKIYLDGTALRAQVRVLEYASSERKRQKIRIERELELLTARASAIAWRLKVLQQHEAMKRGVENED